MIIKNSKEIRKIYFGSAPAPSLNYNGSKAWQHIVDEYVPPVYTCPDVVQTMDGYDGDAKEVYAKDTEKWYMRNNLGNYEEYGILDEVQSLDSATFYEGKLVIFDNHEYESIGGNWVDLGAAQGTTKKIKSPSYIYNDSSHLFSIPVGYTASTDTKFIMKIRPTDNGGGAILGDNEGTSDQTDYRVFLYSNNFYFDAPGSSSYGNRIYGGSFLNKDSELEFGNFYIKSLKTDSNVVTGTSFTYQRTSTLILGESNQYGHMATDKFQLSALTMYHGDTLERDFIPAIDGNDICLYDKVSDAYFKSDNGKMPLSGGTITEVEVGGGVVYPKDYEVKDAPEDNVTVESLDLIECPYEGMTAYVNGVRYTYENGEWIEHTETDWSKEYLTFEAIDDCYFTFSCDNYFYATTSTGLGTWYKGDTSTRIWVQNGGQVRFKADATILGNDKGIGTFTSTGRFNAMGNPYSLLWSSGFGTVSSLAGKTYALNRLFRGCSELVSAENLILPATTLSPSCYKHMFSGCTSLTVVPELPAENLVSSCYEGMFELCGNVSRIKAMFTTNALNSTSYIYYWVNGVASSGTFVKNKNATWSNSDVVSAIPRGGTVVLSD